MTKIEIFRKNNNIIGYRASGHSNYDVYGKDIVCSSISSVLQLTLMGLQETLKLKVKFKIEENKNSLMEVFILEDDIKKYEKEISILMDTMYLFIKELQKIYPNFIKLVEKEEK